MTSEASKCFDFIDSDSVRIYLADSNGILIVSHIDKKYSFNEGTVMEDNINDMEENEILNELFKDSNVPSINNSPVSVVKQEKKLENKHCKSLPKAKKRKLYKQDPFQDIESEKRRQNACNSKRNRDEKRNYIHNLESELAKYKALTQNLEKELQMQKATLERDLEVALHEKDNAICDKKILELQHQIELYNN